MGFEGIFSPLYAVEHLRTGLLDGTLPVLKLFFDGVAPILSAAKSGDDFRLMEAVRHRSPLLDPKYMKDASNQLELLERVGAATQSLTDLFDSNDPLIADVVHILTTTGLLSIPDRLQAATLLGATTDNPPDTSDRDALEIHAYQIILGRRFSEMTAFASRLVIMSRKLPCHMPKPDEA